MATAEQASARATDMEALYQQRLSRYVTAMRNEKPDMIPIRPFVAEFTGKYAGYTCQEVAHDYEKAFAAARQVRRRLRLGRRGGQHGLRLDRPGAGVIGLLRHPGHRRAGRHGLSVPASRRRTTPSCGPTSTTS